MVTIAFKDLAITNAAKRGMPLQRICFTPHPVWGKTDEEMYAYLEGNDPVSGKPLMKEVIDALTTPLTADEMKTGTVDAAGGRADVHGHFRQPAAVFPRQRHDGLHADHPAHAGKSGRDAEGHEPQAGRSGRQDGPAQGAFPPWSYNVRQVAINAVMAGCDAGIFPDRAGDRIDRHLAALFSSTNSLVSAAVINGPIRDKLQMNYGIGAMGPFNQANATIGRAWTLHVEESRRRRNRRARPIWARRAT